MRSLVAAALLLCGLALVRPEAQAQGVAPVMVLIPGAGGAHPEDFLVASTGIFQAAGFDTRMTTSAWEAASLISQAKARGAGRHEPRSGDGRADAGRRGCPDNVVFAAGGLMPPGTPNGSVIEALRDPATLPRTLVLHHRQDECRMTPPEAVPEFVRWSRGRAQASWVTGGGGGGFPCRPGTPHTFTGRTDAAAGAIVRFARGR